MPKVKMAVLGIFVCALLHQATRFFDFSFITVVLQFEGECAEFCHMDIPGWVTNIIGEDTYFKCYYLFRVLFVHTLPCIVLVVLNVLLFMALRKAEQNRQRLIKDNKPESRKMRDSQSTTFMLIVVVTVFLVVEIPLGVVTSLHIITQSNVFSTPVMDYGVANCLILCLNCAIAASHPIYFAIYCGMSRQFRQTFSELFIVGFSGSMATGATTTTGNGAASARNYSVVNGARTGTNETLL